MPLICGERFSVLNALSIGFRIDNRVMAEAASILVLRVPEHSGTASGLLRKMGAVESEAAIRWNDPRRP
jgi:hypothetical protein